MKATQLKKNKFFLTGLLLAVFFVLTFFVSYFRGLSATGDVILLWDGGAAPAGWTCISCNPGDPFYQVFPRGAASYSAVTAGASTHTHTVTYGTSSTTTSQLARITGSNFSIDTHTHTISSNTVDSPSNNPQYRSLKFIKASNPTTIPAGAIGIFDTTSLPANWTAYSVQNNNFLRGDGSVATGGQNTHTHNLTITSSSATGSVSLNTGATNTYVPPLTHFHTGSGVSASTDNRPPYIEVVFAKASTNTSIPIGLIAMFDAAPPSSWTSVSGVAGPLNNKFIVGNSAAYGATGGNATHTHSNATVTLGAITGSNNVRTGGTTTSATANNHVHTVTGSFSTDSNLPVYRDVIFAKKGNVAPVATIPSSISQITDGSGYVSFQTTISDADNDNTKLKVEYSSDGGANWYQAYLAGATPSSGSIDLNNTNPYQIGTANPIDTSGGNITLTIIWDTKSASNGGGSLNNQDLNNVQLRVTPNDGTIDGITQTSGSFSLDNKAPVITASNVFVTGCTGIGGACKNGDTVTLKWNGSASGDNETDTISQVIFNATNFKATDNSRNGSNAGSNLWQASLSGALDSQEDTGNIITATVTDDAGNVSGPVTSFVTYIVDTIIPTAPGNLSFSGTKTDISITLNFGTTGSDSNFDQYKIFYKANAGGVTEADAPWSKLDDANLGFVNYNGAGTTTVTSLSEVTPYFFNIWIYDLVGNKNSATEIGPITTNPGNTAPSISGITASQQTNDGYVNIDYTLSDGESNACSLTVYEYSLTGAFAGEESPMTQALGDPNHDGVVGLSSSPGGTAHTFVWNAPANLGNTYNITVYIRIRANDGLLDSNYGILPAPIVVDTKAPVVSNISTSQNLDGSKLVIINYDLDDDSPNNLTVQMDISADSGFSWFITQTFNNISTGNKTITWDAGADFPNQELSTMQIRIKAKDSYQNQGIFANSSDFDLDTLDPIGLNTLTVSSTTYYSADLNWSAITEGNFDHYEIWYGANLADVQTKGASAAEWDGVNDINLNNKLTTSTVIPGLLSSSTYYFKIWAYDSFGNSETIPETSTITQAPPPSTPPTYVSLPEPPPPLPEDTSTGNEASGAVTSGEGGTITLADQSISIEFPAGAVNDTVIIKLNKNNNPFLIPTDQGLLLSFDAKAYLWPDNQLVNNFNKDFTLRINYGASDELVRIDKNSINIYYWNESQNKWETIPATLNINNNELILINNHFTTYAVMGKIKETKPISEIIPEKSEFKEYIVKPGEYLSLISLKLYGTDKKWPNLVEWNKENYPSLAYYPGWVVAGWKIKYQDVFRDQTQGVYMVQMGDSLRKIAEKLYGDSRLFEKLIQLNRIQYPSLITNPNLIYRDWKLRY